MSRGACANETNVEPSGSTTCRRERKLDCIRDIALTNGKWFSVVCTLIDNDIRHHSGQNVVDSRGAAEWVLNKFWLLWWRISWSIRVQTTLNHFRFVFYRNIQRQRKFLFQSVTKRRRSPHVADISQVWSHEWDVERNWSTIKWHR